MERVHFDRLFGGIPRPCIIVRGPKDSLRAAPVPCVRK